MYSKIIINFILMLFLAATQLSFISGLPAGLHNFNLVLVVLVFILILTNFNLTAWWAVGMGTFFGILSFTAFGVDLFCLYMTVVAVNFLLINFFTNRSLYSILALVVLATFVYEFFLNFIIFLEKLIFNNDIGIVLNAAFWNSKLSQLALNLFASFIIFYLINFVSKKLKPAFLVKKIHS